jgi:hypothetical protein
LLVITCTAWVCRAASGAAPVASGSGRATRATADHGLARIGAAALGSASPRHKAR